MSKLPATSNLKSNCKMFEIYQNNTEGQEREERIDMSFNGTYVPETGVT